MVFIRAILLTAAAALSLAALPAWAQQMRMDGHAMPAGKAEAAQQVSGTGTVRRVDTGKRMINLSHEAIPAIGWPQMTMDFAVDPKVDLSGVKPGQAVEFGLTPAGGGNYTVTSIKPQS